MPGIVETLDLDISPALAKITQLKTGVERAVGKTPVATPRVDTKPAERDIQKLTDKLHDVGNDLTKFGRTASRNVTLPIVAGLVLATKSASDLAEQQNKVNVVFGTSAHIVSEFAAKSATSLGQSRRAALEAAGTFGNLFRALGLTESKSAEMSTSLLQLSADLASFNNANPEEVFLAIRSGLVGEVEPLRKFGVSLSQVRVEQEAVNLGLIKQGEELTSAAKAQAVYSIVLQDTKLAQGDFARTSEGLANQTRILKAELEDTAATIGQQVIPIALQGAKALAGLLAVFVDLDPTIQATILGGVALAAAIGPLTLIVENAITVVRGLAAAVTFLAASETAAAVAGSGFGLALAGALVGAYLFQQALNAVRTATVGMVNSQTLAINTAAVHGKVTKESAVAAYQNAVALNSQADAMKGANTYSEAFGPLIEKAAGTLRNLSEASGVSRERIAELATEMGVNLATATDDERESLAAAITEIGRGVTSAERLEAITAGLTSTTKTAAEAFDLFAAAVDAALGIQIGAEEASSNYQAAIVKLSESLKENGSTTDLLTEKGRANAANIRDVTVLAEKEVGALTEVGQVSATTAAQKQALIDRLEGLKQKFPQLGAVFDGYIAKVKEIPEEATTTVTVKGTDIAIDQLQAVARAAYAAGNSIERSFTVIPGGGRLRAAGGTVQPGEVTVVGEVRQEIARYPGGRSEMVGVHGPEVRRFPAGTVIDPNVGGSGGGDVIINTQAVDADAIARRAVALLADRSR